MDKGDGGLKLRRIIAGILIALVLIYIIFYCDSLRFAPVLTSEPVHTAPFNSYKGAIHIHTVHSDGGGTIEEVAHAAEKIGLDFVIISDHNAGPEVRHFEGYYGNVLVIIGSEVSAVNGHFLYIPHPDSIFYSVEDVRKRLYHFGDAGIILWAHPDLKEHPVTADSSSQLNGIEIVNADRLWRRASLSKLVQAVVLYPFVHYVLNVFVNYHPEPIQLWRDILKVSKHQSIILGSVDAHSKIKITKSISWKFPSYERIFQTVNTTIMSNWQLNKDYKHDARIIYSALKSGASYIGFESLGKTTGFSYTILVPDTVLFMGSVIKGNNGKKLCVTAPHSVDIRTYIKTADSTVATTSIPSFEFTPQSPGSYYVEVYQLRKSFLRTKTIEVPWIISNAITITK